MMQLEGPYGPVYVSREDIVALEGGPYNDVTAHMVRDLHVRGASRVIQVVDSPSNVSAILDALNRDSAANVLARVLRDALLTTAR